MTVRRKQGRMGECKRWHQGQRQEVKGAVMRLTRGLSSSMSLSVAWISSLSAVKRRSGALALTSNRHGSISPLVFTTRLMPSGAAVCAPHIHRTLSPRTEGTDSCAPTSAS